MKQVFSSPDSAQVGLARSQLDAAGIACEVRNDAVSQAVPGMPFNTELWVLRDEDYEDARRLILSGSAPSAAPHTKSKTNFKLWAVVFLLLSIPASFYQMYPDHPLWLAFLLAPLMLVQGLVSRDSVVVGHLLLLAAAFLILSGTSWVIHCCVISFWRKKHEGLTSARCSEPPRRRAVGRLR